MERFETDSLHHYQLVARAIRFINVNFKEQPSLEDIAKHVHLSPHHFHRLFSDWAGTTPKKFLQYISIGHAKHLLESNRHTRLFETAVNSGLSGTSRLHDLFISIEGMTPAEYRDGGKNLSINYSFSAGPFGIMLVASTEKGICYLGFVEDKNQSLLELREKFPNALYKEKIDEIQHRALSLFEAGSDQLSVIKCHLRGTDFQLNVWQALLKIPSGNLSTYGRVAKEIGNPKSHRAVGTAIGRNPVAYLIPCHRVIQSTGNIGGYMWGNTRKSAIIGWEASKSEYAEP
ncbi:MAG: methylated-DNA--[protein]-cysteine S-methyltransferase [Balneolaceae bacterium]|nr:methylated-DNA--[protein]-cysteine S-methyltransferase [Balneolaceae bacterium]